ncbi:hypothetical protein ACCI51_08170 [Microbulbifer echini]|uniref:DUF1616 domain-containing protein n=1 Tax=Microbulbifer echini TaxID=1529067 RepID=A0ABV4NM70_9GAMM
MNSHRKVREFILIFSTALALVPVWFVGIVEVEIWVLLRVILLFCALMLGLKIYDLLGVYELKVRLVRYGFLSSALISVISFQFLRGGFAGVSEREWFVAVSFLPLITVVLMQKIVSFRGLGKDE